MNVVLKYVIPDQCRISIPIHEAFEVLAVGAQGEEIVAWVMVDDSTAMIARRFYKLYTGVEIPHDAGTYYGTVTDSHGYVIHVFEKL